jgi:hypothetical protein
MRHCQACGYLTEDCVCDRVEPVRRLEPQPLACHCCGLPSDDEDQLCDNQDCSLYGLESA